MMQAIKQSGMKNPWTLMFKTKSSKPNWCFHRFRLYTADANTIVEARRPDGTILDTQLFRPVGSTWGGGFEHGFLFDFSYNTAKEDIEIYIRGIGSSKFQQVYAVYGHAGSAVRYAEDPAASGMTNAELSYVNMELLKFDYGGTADATTFVYLENQGLNSLGAGANQFFGKTINVSGNNLPSTEIDQLVLGCDNNGKSVAGYLNISGNSPRTAASDAAWASLGTKGWNLIQ